MQITHTRHKLHIHWHKVVIFVLLLAMVFPGKAQNDPKENLIDYDLQWIHYGFLIGLHSSKYRIQYDDLYSDLDSLHSIVPGNLPGWKVGFVVDMLLSKQVSFRLLPTVGFYEYDLTYRFDDYTTIRELKPATVVELPTMIKYKSARRGNVAMYVTGGLSPGFEAAGKGDQLDTKERLKLRDWNLSVDAGIGFDMYFPLFKFSPEVRYQWGLRNMLTGDQGEFNSPLQKLTYQNFTFYFTFEGGPSYVQDRKKKK